MWSGKKWACEAIKQGSTTPASPQARLIRNAAERTFPMLRFHLSWPVSGLPSRTASPSHAALHSGVDMRPAEIISALVYRCGGSTRLFMMNACFPFNCASETTRGHQNAASVVVCQEQRQSTPFKLAMWTKDRNCSDVSFLCQLRSLRLRLLGIIVTFMGLARNPLPRMTVPIPAAPGAAANGSTHNQSGKYRPCQMISMRCLKK